MDSLTRQNSILWISLGSREYHVTLLLHHDHLHTSSHLISSLSRFSSLSLSVPLRLSIPLSLSLLSISISKELFYQLVLFDFANFGLLKLTVRERESKSVCVCVCVCVCERERERKRKRDCVCVLVCLFHCSGPTHVYTLLKTIMGKVI